jgi:serine phosphatase RsbU (regulator of sigma subunit)
MSRTRRSLQRKYALLFAVLVTGTVLATSAAELAGVYNDQQLALARLEQAEARGAAARIEQFLAGAERDLSNAIPAFWAVGGGTLDQRMNEYQRLLRQSPAFTEVLYVDSLGREQIRVSRLGLNLTGTEVEHARDPLFLAARAQGTAYSQVYFRDGSEPYITIARAEVGPNGGVLIAEVNLKFIWDVVSRIRVGQSGSAYVVDSQGTLIAHPNISLVLRKTNFSQLPQVQTAIAPLAAGAADVRPGGMVAVDEQGRQILTAYEVVRPLNWLVFTQQPLGEAFAPVVASVARTIALLFAGLAVALAASVVVARRMVRPIEAIQAGTARIGDGILDRPIELHTGDELETLAEKINGMTGRLRDSYVALERTTAERERQAQELRIARDIQQALLPSEITAPDGWSISTHYQPARVVGGDLYDLLPLPDGRLGLVIGDVAGEGVPAALLMATTRTVIRSVVAQGSTAPSEVLAKANALLYPDTPPNLFVTCLFAVLDPATGQLRYANAGHVAPLRRGAVTGQVDQLRARGMPLGLLPGSAYEEKEATLGVGETVLFYSDGVVEAHDTRRDMFDVPRLTAVAAAGEPTGAALIQRVLGELERFTGPGWEQEDDVTLLTLERLEETTPTCPIAAPPQWTSAPPRGAPALSISAAR